MVPLFAGAAYYALFGGEYSLMEMRRLERERDAEAIRLTETRNQVEMLKLRADSLEKDSATLERIALERYGMIREGERLYRFVDTATAKPIPRDSAEPDTTS